VHKWELWNEPNQHFNWKPAPDVTRYAAWFTAVRAAILERDPSASIALGGLAGITASPDGDPSGMAFLQQLHQLGVEPDIIALHPYAAAAQPPDHHIAWENNFDVVAEVHDYLASTGRETPIWITEWGWSTGEVTQEQQAAYVAQSLRMIRDEYPYVTLATYFLDYDRQPDYHFGLAGSDMTPKPAAWEFAAFMSPRTDAPAQVPASTAAPAPTGGPSEPPATTAAPPPSIGAPPGTKAPASMPVPTTAPIGKSVAFGVKRAKLEEPRDRDTKPLPATMALLAVGLITAAAIVVVNRGRRPDSSPACDTPTEQPEFRREREREPTAR
jgi:hypothetical protein